MHQLYVADISFTDLGSLHGGQGAWGMQSDPKSTCHQETDQSWEFWHVCTHPWTQLMVKMRQHPGSLSGAEALLNMDASIWVIRDFMPFPQKLQETDSTSKEFLNSLVQANKWCTDHWLVTASVKQAQALVKLCTVPDLLHYSEAGMAHAAMLLMILLIPSWKPGRLRLPKYWLNLFYKRRPLLVFCMAMAFMEIRCHQPKRSHACLCTLACELVAMTHSDQNGMGIFQLPKVAERWIISRRQKGQMTV